MSLCGFTKSYRQKWENPVFRNLLESAIWAWMCDTAAWQDTKIRFNGKLINLLRGQLITSRGYISDGFLIGEQVTRTFLGNLEKDGMINQQPTSQGTIITICNYDKYQQNDNIDNHHNNQQPTSSQPANQPALYIDKEGKNIRKERKKEDSMSENSFFEKFWDVFPSQRKGNKTKARSAWKSALTRTTQEKIYESAKIYASSDEVARGFAKGAAAWLNDDRWENDYSATARPGGGVAIGNANPNGSTAPIGGIGSYQPPTKWQIAAARVIEKIERGEL